MKKLELRNIIRESIKQLMTEQTSNARRVETLRCDGTHPSDDGTFGYGPCSNLYPNVPHFANAPSSAMCTVSMNASTFNNMTIGGQVPQIGDTFNNNLTSNFPPPYQGWLGQLIVVRVHPASTNSTYRDFPATSACPPFSGSSSGCDPNAPFPPNFNLQSWTSMWTSLPNFSSSNPNQPCNFVCGRRNQWTAQLAAGGMGPAQTNMVACRLEEAENQYQIHNCANSSANNCP